MAMLESVAEVDADIQGLDLQMVEMKLQEPDEGLGWSTGYCTQVGLEYRRFLALTRWYPERAIVPSRVVDSYWHYHILDTQAYMADCDRLFGHYLHHYPYFGMRGPADAQALGDAYDETLALYEHHFGAPPEDLWAREGAARCPNCGRRCRRAD